MKGILKVKLIDAKGLPNKDSAGKMDPYVVVQYKDQKLKSKVAKDHGCNPVWNDDLTVLVHYPDMDGDYSIVLKIMDKDTFSSDDFIGEARINLKDLVFYGVEKENEELQPRYYKVVDKNRAPAGEIQVAFAVTLKEDILIG